MTDDRCEEMQLLIQADVDGELSPADAARVGAHLATCAACREMQAELLALSGSLRREASYHRAPEALRAAVHHQIAAFAQTTDVRAAEPASRSPRLSPWWQRLPRPRLNLAVPFGASFAAVACLALLVLLRATGGGLQESVVASHIRALQPGHLMDVVSTDQHTVKPWFDGRLDFAPPVKDLARTGFPLIGGRIDYLADRPVAALVYHRRQHVIELFAWPESARFGPSASEGSHSGYNYVHWAQDGMVFWAVSDLSAPELDAFVRLWQAAA